MIAPMAARSPARFLAPLALLAFVLALFIVVGRSAETTTPGGAAKTGQDQSATPAGDSSPTPRTKGRRFYRVKAGDTPSSIAERHGVPLSQIQELNPDLDPQTLAPGQRIKLRP
jgi:LysM repeat protein